VPSLPAFVVSLLTFAVTVLLFLAPAVPETASDFAGIDEAMNEAVASGEIPGVVVLVGREDDTLYFRATGSRRLVPEPVAMTRDTIFDVASLTKPFATTLAVMRLVETGDIRLDEPVGRYLKEFRRRDLGHHHPAPADAHRRSRRDPDQWQRQRRLSQGGGSAREAAARLSAGQRLPVQRHGLPAARRGRAARERPATRPLPRQDRL